MSLYAECGIKFIVMLAVIFPSVVMLNVIMLSVMAPYLWQFPVSNPKTLIWRERKEADKKTGSYYKTAQLIVTILHFKVTNYFLMKILMV